MSAHTDEAGHELRTSRRHRGRERADGRYRRPRHGSQPEVSLDARACSRAGLSRIAAAAALRGIGPTGNHARTISPGFPDPSCPPRFRRPLLREIQRQALPFACRRGARQDREAHFRDPRRHYGKSGGGAVGIARLRAEPWNGHDRGRGSRAPHPDPAAERAGPALGDRCPRGDPLPAASRFRRGVSDHRSAGRARGGVCRDPAPLWK